MHRKTVGLLLLLALAACLWAAPSAKAIPPQDGEENVVKIMRTTNKAQTNKFVCDALEFKNVNPFNLVNFFWAVVSREEGGVYVFANPEGNAGYIVVICPEYQLESLRTLAKQLDREGLNSGPGSAYVYYRLKHRSIADDGFFAVLGNYIGSSGALLRDVETNSVLIFDANEGAAAAMNALSNELDMSIRQVELKVKMYEVNVSNDGTLGLDFIDWKNGPGQALFNTRNYGATVNSADFGAGHYDARFSNSFVDYPSAFFDFLAAKGRAKAISDVKIMASSSKAAHIAAMDEVIYYSVSGDSRELEDAKASQQQNITGQVVTTITGTALGESINIVNSTPGATVTREVPVKAGVELDIVPVVGDQMVNLDWELNLSSIQGYDGSGNPVMKSLSDSGEVATPVNSETTIGGVVRDEIVKTTRKVPILGSLPIVGYIFGSEVNTNKRFMVLASVTPTLMCDDSNCGTDDEDIKGRVWADVVKVIPGLEDNE